MRYRRANSAGGTYFFTLALAERNSALLIEHVDRLREIVTKVRQHPPFDIDAMVVLHDHLHAIWRLSPDDADFPKRWSLIKASFSRGFPKEERIRASRVAKLERGIWQRRYLEHQVRDEQDLQAHVDYIHFNPVKHGYVERACDWPYSSIHRYIRMGWLNADWGVHEKSEEDGKFGE